MNVSSVESEPARILMARLTRALGYDGAHRALDIALRKFTNVELAALAHKWEFWARPKQLAPAGNWRSWGNLGGRGSGKTLPNSKHVNAEVFAGRAMLVGLAAQDEANSIALQVTGPSGLVATSPPWFKPEWHPSELTLVWPNGAKALVRTPEVPGKIRGPEFHLTWLMEIQSWPTKTRDEAWSNFQLATRLGYARTIWDATPKRGHPILKELLARSAAEPEKHVVVRSTTYENRHHLGDGYIEDLEKKFKGTRQGREELLGEMLDDDESALVKQEWINDARRDMPSVIERKVIGADPAITARAGSDNTGIVWCGSAVDGQLLVLGDASGKHPPHEWAKILLDVYLFGRVLAENERLGDTAQGCDLIVVETNRGGDLCVQNLRAAAKERGLRVVVVDEKWTPHREAGVVFVREVHSRGSKGDRARPLATAYERRRVSHVRGVNLAKLEETLTTWEPEADGKSPDDLDALVSAGVELLDLKATSVDGKAAFVGLDLAARDLFAAGPSPFVAALFGGDGNRRI